MLLSNWSHLFHGLMEGAPDWGFKTLIPGVLQCLQVDSVTLGNPSSGLRFLICIMKYEYIHELIPKILPNFNTL